ncbi:hypothetical protein DL96DRAFT_1572673 [Flagelloscypha sp. PMI_526]|nr:hypothetical protein DL96DRAFT_1572673 [Flagelloscypha sp. PMI_526]
MATFEKHVSDAKQPHTVIQTRLPHISRRRETSLFLAVVLFSLYRFLPHYIDLAENVSPPPVIQETGDGWSDHVWPIHNQTFWDISTSAAYPRKQKFTVREGTWMRLDVNPVNSDIVFGLLGDMYCIPASEYLHPNSGRLIARPIIQGVPWDTDPQFSPSGDALAWRSDAGLGVENIWLKPYTNCESMNLRPEQTSDEDFARILAAKEEEDELLAQGVPETEERRVNRLQREGRLDAQRVTNETYRSVTEPRFHPDGKRVLATKWYTSSRSIGAGEVWEYSLPNLSVPQKEESVPVASGHRLIGRSLPLGWDEATQYGDQQIGPEEAIWWKDDGVIFAKNVLDSSVFHYSKDVHSGIYAIFARNLTSGGTSTLVSQSPGGASRPTLSKDGRTLAFVRRNRDKETLVLKDLITGTIHYAFDGLTLDLTTIFAPMGTYPLFSFTPSDDAVIIWAAGQIYVVPLAVNSIGERVASQELLPRTIPFEAIIEKRLAALRSGPKGGFDILAQETSETQPVRVITGIRPDTKGESILFEAAGLTYVSQVSKDSTPKRIPALGSGKTYFSPSWIPDRDGWAIQARWDDLSFTEAFELVNISSGTISSITGFLPGRYFSPIISPASKGSSSRRIAFLKTSGDIITGDIVATAQPGLWIGDLSVDFEAPAEELQIKNLTYYPSSIDPDDLKLKLSFIAPEKLLVQQASSVSIVDISSGKASSTELATGRMSSELSLSSEDTKLAAFVDFYQVYIAPYPAEEPYWSKPAYATPGLTRVSKDGGHDIIWSGDGKRLIWTLGPFIHYVDTSDLKKCFSGKKHKCAAPKPHYFELKIPRTTDIERLKQEAGDDHVLVLQNATVVTFDNGVEGDDIIEHATIVVRDGVIQTIAAGETAKDLRVTSQATVLDLEGAYVVPGFIDVHAHWSAAFGTRYPATSWELEAFLAYGVTTLHNPSADNVFSFREREWVESGKIIGPRIYTVGGVIYGAADPTLASDIVDMDEAYSTLLRLRAEGGGAALSYKNYQIPVRGARQRLLAAALDLGFLCVPEGGMNLDWDTTFVIDGMTTVEHAIPVPVLYDDYIQFVSASGTGNTPTHLVNYGGAFGEQWIWGHNDLPNNEKLRRFTRHDILAGITETTSRPLDSWQFVNTSESVAKMVRKGLKAHIGAHGEPPLGFNYHEEMGFAAMGGLSNYETLRAATSDAAETLGLFNSLGSITEGKLADIVVFKQGADILNDHISVTRQIQYTIRGGRVWDVDSMEEVWPVKGRKQNLPPINPE